MTLVLLGKDASARRGGLEKLPHRHGNIVTQLKTGGYSVLYTRVQALFRDLAMARADCSLLVRGSRIDMGYGPLLEPERRDFWEICGDPRNCRAHGCTNR